MKKRESNYELLRIVSMIMIIVLHFITFSGIRSCIIDNSLEYYIFYTLMFFCLSAVNIYILLSGYFMVNSKFKLSKVLKIELEVIFYSVSIYLLIVLFGIEKFNFRHFIVDLFPTLMARYWFITGYIFLYLLSPFLNRFMKSISKNIYKYLLLVLFFILVVVGTVNPINRTLSLSQGYSLIWMIYIYLVGGYIRLHYNKNDSSIKLILIITLCISLKILLYLLFKKFDYINVINNIIIARYAYNNIFVFFESICIFLLFRKFNIKNKITEKIILFISSSTLAVYLIHMNYDLYLYMWKYINPIQYINNNKIYLCLVLSILSIFIICIFIDKIRLLLVKIISFIPCIKKIFYKIDKFIDIKMGDLNE